MDSYYIHTDITTCNTEEPQRKYCLGTVSTLFCTLSFAIYCLRPDYAVIGFDMEVQPLVTHNAACPLCVSAICIGVVSKSFAIRAYAMSAVGIDVVSVHKLFAYRVVSAVSIDIVSSHTKYCRIAFCITR